MRTGNPFTRWMHAARATTSRICVVAAACSLLLALGASADAQEFFDTPAAWVRSNYLQDYDVTTNVTPLSPRFAEVSNFNGSGKTHAEASATQNGARGFRAVTEIKTPTW